MHNHYTEALNVIKKNTAELAVVNAALGLQAADYHRFLAEERVYLHGLKKEPEEEVQRYEYVAALEELSALKSVYSLHFCFLINLCLVRTEYLYKMHIKPTTLFRQLL